jgi:hypothetical protein
MRQDATLTDEGLVSHSANQTKEDSEQYRNVAIAYSNFSATILHHPAVPPERLKTVREAIIVVYDLEPDAKIKFFPVAFLRPKPKSR